MDRTRFETPPQWWGPQLNPLMIRVWKPLRRMMQRRNQRLEEIEVQDLENLSQAIDAGYGILITPNHSGHADAFILYHASDQLRRPFYFMTAWQVLGLVPWYRRMILRHHGCFSVDREGTDLRAFKQAVDILTDEPNPLVVFPEGEVYHLNERVTPFREGPATMALTAAKKADRQVVCIPCGIRYYYVTDPLPELKEVMGRLEEAVHWRRRDEMPLPDRIYRFAEGMLALKELEYLKHTRTGPLPERVQFLSDAILRSIETEYELSSQDQSIPERVKACRQQVIKRKEVLEPGDAVGETACHRQLDDLFLVVQLFSYPGDYVAEQPTIERLAETIDKFEEDVLTKSTATIRAQRRVVVTFGEPIVVEPSRNRRQATAELTQKLESAVQAILDSTTK